MVVGNKITKILVNFHFHENISRMIYTTMNP